MRNSMLHVGRSAVLAAGCVFFGFAAHADAYVWQGSSGGSWNTAANWAGGAVPNGSGVEVDFSAASGTYSVNVDVAVTIGKITVNGASAATLTLSGSKITFAGSSTPEIYVGTGHTLLTTSSSYGGTQGVRKTGGGTWKPTVKQKIGGSVVVEAGALQPVNGGANLAFCDSIEVWTGASFKLPVADTFASSTQLKALGGTIDFTSGIDYMGLLTFSNGGLMNCGNMLYVIDNNSATATITANGDGVAGTFSGPLVGESRFGAYQNNRTIEVNVANAGAEFTMTGYLLENRLQGPNYGNDIYHGESASPYFPVISLKKVGAGDLVLHDETISLTGGANVDAGRLILSNTVKMAASAITLKTGVNQLILREGATLQIGGVNCATAGALDLGGNIVDVGGTATDSALAGTVVNGTIRKVGYNTQQVAAPLAQRDLDVLGGTLSIGLPIPKVRYTFDDEANIGKDSGSVGKHLSVSNVAGIATVTWSADGKSGGCASFNGTGSLFAATGEGLPCGNSAFTTALWIKPGRYNYALVTWGNPAGSSWNGFVATTDKKLKHVFWEGANDFESDAISGTYTDGTWRHVAVTYDPATGTRKIYVNGEFLSSKVVSGTRTVDATKPFCLGIGKNNNDYIGKMDEVMVFDQALSAEQIAALKSWGENSALSTTALASGGTVRLERDATLAIGMASQTFTAISGKGTLALNSGAEATVASDSATSIGRLTGDGTLTKTGSGTLSLTAAANLGGTIDVKGGSVLATGPCVDDDLKSHLIAWWNFNDRDNPGRDASGNGVDIVAPTTGGGNTTGIAYNWRNAFETVGGAAYLDGKANHYFVMADSANEARLPSGANPTFTVAMWINPDSDVLNAAGLFYWGAATAAAKVCVALRFDAGTHLNPFFWGGGDYKWQLPSDFKTGVAPDGWHHVVFAAGGDSHVRALYVDGQYVAGGTNTTALELPAANFRLGCEISRNQPFKGYMDDVMIFDRVLTADEVRAVMNGLGDAPSGGSKVKIADNTSFSVAAGTVGLSGVTGEGDVSVAADAKLVLAGGASEIGGELTGDGLITVTNGALLHLAGGQNFAGTVAVAVGGTLDCRGGASATVNALTLAEGAGIAVSGTEFTSTPCVTSTAAVALPATANVVMTVPSGKGAKIEVLHSSAGLSGDVSGWTVDWNLPRPSWTREVFVRGNSVWVEARPRGMVLMYK